MKHLVAFGVAVVSLLPLTFTGSGDANVSLQASSAAAIPRTASLEGAAPPMQPASLPPAAATATLVHRAIAPAPVAPAHAAAGPIDAGIPVRVRMPSIGLNAPIIPVGVNSKGEMDVPNGKSNDIGWYKNGARPGQIGSAVLDAHVFAALKNLKDAKVGDDIYIDAASGSTLHFVVAQSATYKLSDINNQVLFNRGDAARLNLITCAGTYLPGIGTYDHRLIVYATLAG